MKTSSHAQEFLRKRLKALREAVGCTQEEVAEKAGLSLIYYQAIEAGRRPNVSLLMLEKIALAYGLSIHELFAPALPQVKKFCPIPRPHYQRRGRCKKVKVSGS